MSEKHDRSKKALQRRSNIYIARAKTVNGITDADPMPEGDEHRQDQAQPHAAREHDPYAPSYGAQYGPLTTTPPRIRRQPPPDLSVSDDCGDQAQHSALNWQDLKRKFWPPFNDEFDEIWAAEKGNAAPKARTPRIIHFTLQHDQTGLHFYFYLSRGAIAMLLGLLGASVLFAVGELTDALEIIARLL